MVILILVQTLVFTLVPTSVEILLQMMVLAPIQTNANADTKASTTTGADVDTTQV